MLKHEKNARKEEKEESVRSFVEYLAMQRDAMEKDPSATGAYGAAKLMIMERERRKYSKMLGHSEKE